MIQGFNQIYELFVWLTNFQRFFPVRGPRRANQGGSVHLHRVFHQAREVDQGRGIGNYYQSKFKRTVDVQ